MNQRNTHMDNLISPNKNGIWHHQLALASGLSGIMLGACSDGANTGESRSKSQRSTARHPHACPRPRTPRRRRHRPPRRRISRMRSRSLRRHLPCTVRPRKGVTDDPARRASSRPTRRRGSLLSAAKGLGSRLTVECGLNEEREESPRGGLERRFHVRAQIEARNRGAKDRCAAGPAEGPVSHVSERPARTGLSPRPDAFKAEKYANWVRERHETHRKCSRPYPWPCSATRRTYEGTYDSPQSMGGPDSSRPRAATATASSLGGDPANAGTLYDVYEAVISVPDLAVQRAHAVLRHRSLGRDRRISNDVLRHPQPGAHPERYYTARYRHREYSSIRRIYARREHGSAASPGINCRGGPGGRSGDGPRRTKTTRRSVQGASSHLRLPRFHGQLGVVLQAATGDG